MMGPGIALLAAGGLTTIAGITRGRPPSPRVMIGAAIAGGVLVAVGGRSPELAAKFGTLVLVTALLTSGADLALAAGRLLAITPPTKETPQ